MGRPGPARLRQVPAVTRAAAILRVLGRSDEPLGVNRIARELGLVPSTCLHILRALVAEQLAMFDPATKRYSLGAGILTIARSYLQRNTFSRVVQPTLDLLADHRGVTAIGVQIVSPDHMVVVALSRSKLPLRLHVDVGNRFPALISATGRCLAAFGGYPWSEIRRRFRGLRWDSPPSLREWRAEIDATRTNGYSIDEGRYLRGVTILAVPVLNARGVMTHGIAAIAVSEQVARNRIDQLAGEMRSLAPTVSQRMGER